MKKCKWLIAVFLIGCGSGTSNVDGGNAGDARVTVGDATTQPDANTTPRVRLIGRTADGNNGRRFEWSGTQIVARFSGTQVAVELEEEWGSHFYEVFVDGQAQSVLETSSGRRTYTVASGLVDGEHELLIHRRTEALFGPTQFVGLEFGGGQLLPPPPPSGRRIEIVGDSITAGYGNEGADQFCSFSAATENHYMTYGAIAARALGAELVAAAWSGIGVYRNNDGSTADTMPVIYERAVPTDASDQWSFDWQPHAVVINLATNDFAQGTPAQGAFVGAYVSFLQRIRQVYPQAHIFAALGSMLSGADLSTARNYIQSAISQVADSKVHFVEFAVQQASDGYGCDWHPSIATNQLMATKLAAAIASELGW